MENNAIKNPKIRFNHRKKCFTLENFPLISCLFHQLTYILLLVMCTVTAVCLFTGPTTTVYTWRK